MRKNKYIKPKNYFLDLLKCWLSGGLFVSGIILSGSQTFMPYSQIMGITCFVGIFPLLRKVGNQYDYSKIPSKRR